MEDFPLKVLPNIPNWSENYALAGFDPNIGVGIFFHVGRWHKDLSLWREVVTILLPDGTVVAHRAIGNANTTEGGPGGPNLKLDIFEDAHRHQWSFLGAARQQLVEHLRDELLGDGPLERFEFNLKFESNFPVWQLAGGKNSAFAGHGHDEQIGRLSGEIKIADNSFHFDSFVNRDHSRGPRLMGPLARHNWFQGYLENGMMFHVYEGEEESNGALNVTFSQAAIIIDEKMYPAKVAIDFHLPMSGGLNQIYQVIPFKLMWDGGELAGKVTEFPTTMHHQFTAPWDTYLGARQIGDTPNRRMTEQAVLYEMDGGIKGYGHMERTVPGMLLTDENLKT